MAKLPLDFYIGFLHSVGVHIDPESNMSAVLPDGSTSPLTIENRRMVLPTHEVLRTLDNTSQIAFHPLCENYVLGPSKVINKLNVITQSYFDIKFVSLITDILNIITDKTQVIPSPALNIAKAIPDVTVRTTENWLKVISRFDGTTQCFLRIYNRRGGELNGIKYRRVAKVTFPIWEEFGPGKPDDQIFGVKMPKKDKATLRALILHLLPDIETDGYSFGSDNSTAPSFHSLANVVFKLSTALGKPAWNLRSHLQAADYRTDHQWYEEMGDLSQYRNTIPTLDGNDGTAAEGDTQANWNTPAVLGAHQIKGSSPLNPVAQQPMGFAANPQGGGLFGGVKNTSQAPLQQPNYQHPQVPVNAYGQPMYPQPQQPYGQARMSPLQAMQGQQPNMMYSTGNVDQDLINQFNMQNMQNQMAQQMPAVAQMPNMMPMMGMPGMMPGMMPMMGMPGMPGMMPNMMPMQGMMPQGMAATSPMFGGANRR